MARLAVTENARADLREIRDYIAKDNPAAARRVIERLRAQARQLAATPGIGRSRQELRPELFSFPVGRHLLFYRPQPGGIVLVRVVHGARDLPALFSGTRTLVVVGCPALASKSGWQAANSLLPSGHDWR